MAILTAYNKDGVLVPIDRAQRGVIYYLDSNLSAPLYAWIPQSPYTRRRAHFKHFPVIQPTKNNLPVLDPNLLRQSICSPDLLISLPHKASHGGTKASTGARADTPPMTLSELHHLKLYQLEWDDYKAYSSCVLYRNFFELADWQQFREGFHILDAEPWFFKDETHTITFRVNWKAMNPWNQENTYTRCFVFQFINNDLYDYYKWYLGFSPNKSNGQRKAKAMRVLIGGNWEYKVDGNYKNYVATAVSKKQVYVIRRKAHNTRYPLHKR